MCQWVSGESHNTFDCVCVCVFSILLNLICGLCQVDEVMLTLKQAFSTAAVLQSNKTLIQLCENCPMHKLHKLCERIEGESTSSLDSFMNKLKCDMVYLSELN